MHIRVADGEEDAEGLRKLACQYHDHVSEEAHEDAQCAAVSVILALREFQKAHPHVSEFIGMVDAATYYKGNSFSLHMSMEWIRSKGKIKILSIYVQPGGQGKSPLDGHFGVRAMLVLLLLGSGLGREAGDAIALLLTLDEIDKAESSGSVARLLEMDRSSTITYTGLPKITSRRRRVFQYTKEGKCLGVELYLTSLEGCIPHWVPSEKFTMISKEGISAMDLLGTSRVVSVASMGEKDPRQRRQDPVGVVNTEVGSHPTTVPAEA